jgi:uncharacterized protein
MPDPETECPIVFRCADSELLGILHPGAADARVGVAIVVGGPQYRVGSHRQFVLLARRLAAAGIPVLRFDCRGMGDSAGDPRSFEDIGADIRAAIDTLIEHRPQVRRAILWGLCDAASAIAVYAPSDPRLAGIAILNPWVRTETGKARAFLRHYYIERLRNPAFWRKALAGRLNLRRSLGALLRFLRQVRGDSAESAATVPDTAAANARIGPQIGAHPAHPGSLPGRMLAGLDAFGGRTLLILSGRDLTAREFDGLFQTDRGWRRWARHRGVERHDLPEADHTFSSEASRAEVERLTLDWLNALADR